MAARASKQWRIDTSPFIGRYQLLPGQHNGKYHLCAYCGEPADSYDHVPPISRYYDYKALYGDAPLHLVRSCGECNAVLANSLQEDLVERIDELKIRLKKKYLKYLNTPYWDEEELAEMGPNLREEVERSQRMAEWVQDRLDYGGGYNSWIWYEEGGKKRA